MTSAYKFYVLWNIYNTFYVSDCWVNGISFLKKIFVYASKIIIKEYVYTISTYKPLLRWKHELKWLRLDIHIHSKCPYLSVVYLSKKFPYYFLFEIPYLMSVENVLTIFPLSLHVLIATNRCSKCVTWKCNNICTMQLTSGVKEINDSVSLISYLKSSHIQNLIYYTKNNKIKQKSIRKRKFVSFYV